MKKCKKFIKNSNADIILGFTTDYLLQQVILKWKKEDSYSDDIVERIMGSIELLKLTEEDQ